MTKESRILIDFHMEDTTNMDEKNRSTEQLFLKCPIPGCKFVGFAKIYDTYKPGLKKNYLQIMEDTMLRLHRTGNGLIGIMVKLEEEKEV